MDFTDFTAGKDDDSRRLDRVLLRLIPGRTHSDLQKLMRKRLVKMNGSRASGEVRLHAGDVISVASFLLGESPCVNDSSPDKSHPDEDSVFPFEKIFENEHILVINKPWNVNVQPSNQSEKSLSEIVPGFIKLSGSISFVPGPLHRLDRLTTGLLAFSKSSLGARWFSDAMKNHLIKKSYVGLADGRLEKDELWCDRISQIEDKSLSSFHTVRVSDDGMEAITLARPLSLGRNLSLVQYDIKTGRKHQIRCQSSFHGHPLDGDTAYGGRMNDEGTFFLHAARLIFPKDNPLGLPCELRCDIPEGFQKKIILDLIKWDGQLIIE